MTSQIEYVKEGDDASVVLERMRMVTDVYNRLVKMTITRGGSDTFVHSDGGIRMQVRREVAA